MKTKLNLSNLFTLKKKRVENYLKTKTSFGIIRKLNLCLILTMLLFGNGFAQRIELFCIYPPEKYLNDVTKITVLDFSGEKGKDMANQITNFLLKEDLGIYDTSGGLFKSGKKGETYQTVKTNIFSVVERNQLDKVLNEQNLSNTGLIDEQQATQIGSIMGLDAIITGSVKITSKDEEKKNTYTRKDGSTYNSYCTKRIVTVEANMKILDVKTGQILANKLVSQTNSDEKCDNERKNLRSVSDIADACVAMCAFQLVYYFNPNFVLTRFDFEKKSNKEFRAKAKEAEEYVKLYDFERAFSIFKTIYDNDPYNGQMAVNLGNIYFIYGDFANAHKYCKIAAQLEPSNKSYQQLLKFTEKITELANYYEKQGYTIEFPKLEAQEHALSSNVTTKGKKSDRFDVKASKSETSETITKVPGATQFVVIEQDEEWILIKLLGDEQGYIKRKDVK